MNRLLGIETEYGITLDRDGEIDPVNESIELIHCYRPGDPTPGWDYGSEDPLRDARGFRAESLSDHPDEAKEAERDRKRRLSAHEIKSDRILFNGARLYNDHAHPEYSTPECRGLFDLVAHDKAGERILLQCARRRAEEAGAPVRIYKNNTDFQGHSYGCHDNYLMDRSVPFDDVRKGLMAFNATRQVFAGAGKVGIEDERGIQTPGHYQIAQRSDFFSVECSVDTMHRRPLVNTRDEPHADPKRYRRLHGIVGDANMSEYATALKVGTTALVLDCIELRLIPDSLALKKPLDAVKAISHDITCTTQVPMADGTQMTAIDVQREYWRIAQSHASRTDQDAEWVLGEWEAVLDALECDPMDLVGRVDWVTKKWLLDAFVEDERVEWADPWLISLDLQYHDVDLDESLYYDLEREGATRRLVTEEQILACTERPPNDTRAYVRGRILERFGRDVRTAQWDALTFGVNGRTLTLRLDSLVEADPLREACEAVDRAVNVDELLTLAKLS